jgi:uncharacterized protein YbbC (DUF1343 family)
MLNFSEFAKPRAFWPMPRHAHAMPSLPHRRLACLALGLLLAWIRPAQAVPPPVRVGIDVLLDEQLAMVQGKRLGLLTNTSAIDAHGVTTLDRLRADTHVHLVQLYAPEHGLRLTGANGVTDRNGVDAETGLPVEGLNSHRGPSRQSLRRVDLVLVDIQDIGSRTFTYGTTLAKTLAAAAQAKVPVLVLDRPNPQGGLAFEGPVLQPRHWSAVGWGPLPVTHGLTLAELARFYVGELKLHTDLRVVAMHGWRRGMTWEDTGLRWSMPATAVTLPTHAHLYAAAGMVGGCGVNADDGVTALRFFERVAASYADADQFTAAMQRADLPGVNFQPVRYDGVWGPRRGRHFSGAQMVITDPHAFRPLRTALTALTVLRDQNPRRFKVVRPERL